MIEKCWNIDSCAEFPALFEFRVIPECPSNCALYHGSNLHKYLYDYAMVDCLEEFNGDIPNGCKLSQSTYMFSLVLLFLMFMI